VGRFIERPIFLSFLETNFSTAACSPALNIPPKHTPDDGIFGILVALGHLSPRHSV
jgi:hypothetical protein